MHCAASSTTHGFERFGRVFVIHLKHRVERLDSITKTLASVNVTQFKLVNAVPHECGPVGCTLSHIMAMQECIEGDHETCLLLEDDFVFSVSPTVASESVERFFAASHRLDVDWDVLMLSGLFLGLEPGFAAGHHRVTSAHTTSGYAVRKHFARHLLKNYLQGVTHLNEACNHEMFAIDVHWKKLQPVHRWYRLDPVLGKQAPFFSDTVNEFVDHGV